MSGGPVRADLARVRPQDDRRRAILEFLELLWKPDDVREIRIPRYNDYGITAAGWFDAPEKLADAALKWDGQANIFVTLNPVDRDLLARANNRILNRSDSTTADTSVTRREWLFIDIDPVRPSGISSTDTELTSAHECAEAVAAFLEARSWPDAVVAMSGNGYYLLYPLNLPNDADATALVHTVLAGLSGKFSNERVHVDTSVSNPARIIGLVGTMKVKGDQTDDRKHRRSKMVRRPANSFAITANELRLLADELGPPQAPPTQQRSGGSPSVSVEDLLLGAGIKFRPQPADAKGTTWYHVARCPFHTDGREYECGVGQKLPDGPAAGHCFHPEGSGKGWQDFKVALGLASAAAPLGRVTQLFSQTSLLSQAEQRPWPEPPGPAAFHGLAGRFCEAIEPHTEADPVALLANVLGAFGNAVGAGPHFFVGATPHYAREFMTLVGKTSKARKGDSWPPVTAVISRADEEWATRVMSGLSTGEGLIFQVRDAVEKQQAIKEKGRTSGYEMVVVDEGVEDKRLLVVEAEFAKVLKVMERQGNSLSPVLRTAWDHGRLQTMVKINPTIATDAHISLIGHITVEEFERMLPDVEAANGFMNRFLIFAVQRSRLLPDPEPFRGLEVQRLAGEVSQALSRAGVVGLMTRTPAATELWCEIYPDLSNEQDGLAGALKARAEAHVLRLSMVYALLDGRADIDLPHLGAALELWAYAERSIDYVFGDATGNPVADVILKALRAGGELSRTEISAAFGRHESAASIDKALQQLFSKGKVRVEQRQTGGRPLEMWSTG